MKKTSHTLRAIGYMLGSMFLFALMSCAVRALSSDMNTPMIVFLRNVWSLVLILLWSASLRRQVPRFPTHRLKSHFHRSIVGFCSMVLWIYCLSITPLNLAIALSFTTPIYTTILAMIFLGERAGIRRWCAIFCSFIGVLIMLHPTSNSIESGSFLVLLASFLMACVGIQVKSLTRTDSPETIIFYMTFFMLIFSIPLVLTDWQPVAPHQWLLSFAIAFCSIGAHLLLTRAYVNTEMVVLMPFDFTRLIFVSIFAYVFFGETLDSYTLAGALLIVASTVYISWREKLRAGATAQTISA